MGRVVAGVTARRMVALYVGISIALPAAFWPVRDVPPSWGCGEDEPPGQDAKVDAFEAGAIPLHAVAALILIVALCAWSARRNGGEVGAPTAAGAALACAYLAVMLAWNDAFLPLAVLTFVGTVYLVAPVAALVLAVLAALRPRMREGVVASFGWGLLLYGLPLHLNFIYVQGDGPWFC